MRAGRRPVLAVLVGVIAVCVIAAAAQAGEGRTTMPGGAPPTPLMTTLTVGVPPEATLTPELAPFGPRALEVAAQRANAPVERLSIGNAAVARYRVTGRTAYAFKILDRGTSLTWGVTLDEAGNPVDEQQLSRAEATAAAARFGPVDRALEEVLTTAEPGKLIPVAIDVRRGECPRVERPSIGVPNVPAPRGQTAGFDNNNGGAAQPPPGATLQREQADATVQAGRATVEAVSRAAAQASEACSRAAVGPVLEKLERLGYQGRTPSASLPSIYAVLPASTVVEVARWSEVARVSLDEARYHREGYAGTPTPYPATPTRPPGSSLVPMETVSRGNSARRSDTGTASAAIMRRAQDVAQVSEWAGPGTGIADAAHKVDLSRHVLIAVFGLNGGGNGITVEEVHATNSDVRVIVRLSVPERWRMVSDQIVRPHHMISVPRDSIPPGPVPLLLVDAASGAILARASG